MKPHWESQSLGRRPLVASCMDCARSQDVIEELMGQEILDETDRFADNTRTVEVNDETR